MNIIARTVRHLFCLLFVSIAVSCQQQTPPALPAEAVVQPDAYELFVRAHPRYPRTMEIYRNKELMAKATPYSPIYICLSQQRGRLYVDDKVAADWPVSTGTNNHATPTGRFRVQEKKKTYNSRTWGRIYDADGKCINKDADTRKDRVPEGGKFVGASMPNWHRLTGSGIGMHTGKVRAGRTLSHGCIRTPSLMASQLFEITATGKTRITITKEVEKCYPTFVGTIHNTADRVPAEQQMATPPSTDKPQPIAEPTTPEAPTQEATVAEQNQPTPEEQAPPAA